MSSGVTNRRFQRTCAALGALSLAGLGFLGTGHSAAWAGPADSSSRGGADSTTAQPTPSASASPSAEAKQDAPLTLTLDDLAPAVAHPNDTITFTGTVTNTTDQTLTNPQLIVSVQQAVPRNLEILTQWIAEDSLTVGRRVVNTTYQGEIPAGRSTPFTFSVPVADLGFPIRYDNWGARGLELTLTSGDVSARARTVGVFVPDEEVPEAPLTMSVLLPLTPTAQEWTEAIDAGEPVGVHASSRVEALASAGTTGISWALDPALFDTTAAGGAHPEPTKGSTADPGDGASPSPDASPSPTATPSTADPSPSPTTPPEPADLSAIEAIEIFTDSLEAAAVDRDVLALPWADADIPMLAGAGADGSLLLNNARRDGIEVFASTAFPVSTTVAFPADPGASDDAVAAALAAGFTSIVLAPQDASAESSTTGLNATSRVDFAVDGNVVPGALGNTLLSATVAGDVPFERNPGMTDELASRQLMLATSAVMSRESSSGDAAPTLLAAIDREQAGTLDATELDERLDALVQAPWVSLVGVEDLLLSSPAPTSVTLPESVDVTSGIAAATVQDTVNGLDAAQELRSTLTDATLLDDAITALRASSSSAWRIAGSDGSVASDAGWARINSIGNAITVAGPGSQVNLVNYEGAIPLSVSSTFGQELKVRIQLTTPNAILRIDDLEAITVEPGSPDEPSTQTVMLPVHAVANGTTEATIQVLTPGGLPLGSPSTFTVVVRAEWENIGTGIGVAGLAVLFVLGIIRTVRRGRRGADGVPPTASDSDADSNSSSSEITEPAQPTSSSAPTSNEDDS